MAWDEQGLIDRQREKELLSALLDKPAASLVLVTGRRRIGKTYLLTRTWPRDDTFLFTATNTTPEQNRRQLILDLAMWAGDDLHPDDYPTWRSVFDLLWRTRQQQPLVVILDEFQYLASTEKGLAEVASAMNATFERMRADRPLVVVASGSAVSTLEALVAGGSPLYGRLATHLRLGPLSAYDAATFIPKWHPRAKAAGYGILGGTPAYWAALDPKADLRANAASLLLAREGRLRLQLDTLLAQEEGLGDTAAYTGIIRAIASGATTRSRIAGSTGLKNDHALVRRLDTLTRLDFVEETRNLEAPANAPVRYRITDPALRFHHAFVSPNASLLERTDPIEAYDVMVAPHLDTYMGLMFEQFVAPTYDRLREARGLPMVSTWSRWEGQDRGAQSLEIDVVAPLLSGPVMTGAVKWNRKPLGADVFHHHIESVRRAAGAGLRWAHAASGGDAPLLFLAAGGYDESFMTAARAHPGEVLAWTLEDVYVTV